MSLQTNYQSKTHINAMARLCMIVQQQKHQKIKINVFKAVIQFIDFKSQKIEFKGLSKNKSVLQDETCTHAFLTVATVGVLCGSPGVLQTGKPWGAITEDAQHLCPQVRWELKNIPNDILSRALKFTSAAPGSISYSLSEVFSREKPVTMLSSFTVTYYSCLEPDKHQQLADLGQ